MSDTNGNDGVAANNYDGTITRQRFGDFLSNLDLKIPPSTIFLMELGRSLFLLANTAESMTLCSAPDGNYE